MVRALTIAVPWVVALVVGMLLAFGSVPVILSTAHWYAQWDAENNPPATFQWHSVERIEADALRMQLLVTRQKDCQIVRVMGFTGDSLTFMRPADSLDREDGRAPQSYPVGITVISRPWILRGIYGDKLAVAAYYDCADAIVKAPLLVGDVPALP